MGGSSKLRWTAQSIAGMLKQAIRTRSNVIHLLPPFPWIEPRDALLKIFLRCAGLQVMAPFGAGILLDAGVRCKRLTVCAKGAPDRAVTAVHIGLAQRASRAELCAFCECRRTAPGLLCCCCALRPALSCRSCVRPSRWRQRCAGTCAPAALVLHHTHPVLRALCRSR